MRIGIDARPLIAEKLSGIGNYVINILKYCNNNFDKEYILYSNEELLYHSEIIDRFEKRIIPGTVGTTWVCFGLRRALQNDHIDIFWGTQHMIPLTSRDLRLVLTVHDFALLINPSWGSTRNAIMQNIFGKMSARRADCIIADSESTANDIRKLIKKRKQDIHSIHLGGGQIFRDLTIDEEKSFSEKFNVKTCEYFLYLGTIEPRKNISGIVKAYNIYRRNQGKKKLLIVGGFGWKYKKILQEINNSPYKGDIFLPGYISEAEKSFLLRNTIAFLFPSNYEGFGFPVLEAMAYGIPVITTNVSSLPEVGGEYAYYVESPKDWNKISELMIQIEKMSKEDKQILSEAEKKWYLRFDWKKCAMDTLSLLE